MHRWNVIVVAFDGAEMPAQTVSRELAAVWPGSRIPTFTVAPLGGVIDAPLNESFEAAVLVIDRPVSESTILRLLSQFEEMSVPVLALTPGQSEADSAYALAGALACDRAQPATILAAMLHGLLHRQGEVLRLRQEVALGTRFQGGLRGEMDKLHDELQLAAVVQRELLPAELPAICGVEFAALWRPVNYVSGDIYDIIRLDEDHVGLFLADAVGHGVPAALMTMVLRQSLQPLAAGRSGARIRTPSEVLAQLNQAMIQRQGGTTRFATAVYGVLDCRSRVLNLSGAGHPHPLRITSEGKCTELKTSGGLLGIFPDETFDDIEVDLSAGDRLLMFTDGFEQAFPNPGGGEYPSRLPTMRYRQELEQLAQEESATAAVGEIGQRLDQQRGSLHQIDDLTLICVHARPLAAAMPQTSPSESPAAVTAGA